MFQLIQQNHKLPFSWNQKTTAHSVPNPRLSLTLSPSSLYNLKHSTLLFLLHLHLHLNNSSFMCSSPFNKKIQSMRLSCNGCRVLRKGCSPDCPIRPCLNWIDSPASQANATFFLAKFYGRSGLLNLLTAAPQQLQPAVFKSLLYEACGRIVNPIFGSTGLLSTGSWHLCEAAVNAVLTGAPIQQSLSNSSCNSYANLQLQACDIRHVAKSGRSCDTSDRLQGTKSRTNHFKHRVAKPKPRVVTDVAELVASFSGKKTEGSVSRDSESGVSEYRSIGGEADSRSFECMEPTRTSDGQLEQLELELTLGNK